MGRWASLVVSVCVILVASQAQASIITGADTVQAEGSELRSNGECKLTEIGQTKASAASHGNRSSWTPEARSEDEAIGKIVALLLKRQQVPQALYDKAPSQVRDLLDKMHLVAGQSEETAPSPIPASPGFWRPGSYSGREFAGSTEIEPGHLSQISPEKLSMGSMELPVPGGGEATSLADLEKWFGLKEK